MGSYQAFGDIFIQLGHAPDKVSHYRRELEYRTRGSSRDL